jgi:hypothetical protein
MAQLFGDERCTAAILEFLAMTEVGMRGGMEMVVSRRGCRVVLRRPHAIKVGEISTGLSCLCHFLSGCRVAR